MTTPSNAKMTSTREPAFAKINLFLEVLGKREDGYHHLRSLMAFCDVGEYVSVSPAAVAAFTIGGPMRAGLDESGDNLVLQAKRAFMDAAGLAAPLAVHLHKTMPVSSGIGGGSADAAATLRALNRHFGKPLAEDMLLDIAARLGADVPACFYSSAVFLDGIGPELSPASLELDFPHIVLVNPGVRVSTPGVFADLSAPPLAAQQQGVRPPVWALEHCRARQNDLTAPALAAHPHIGLCLDALGKTNGAQVARMSGSGATCFALFAAASEAVAAAQQIQATYGDWWVANSQFGR